MHSAHSVSRIVFELGRSAGPGSLENMSFQAKSTLFARPSWQTSRKNCLDMAHPGHGCFARSQGLRCGAATKRLHRRVSEHRGKRFWPKSSASQPRPKAFAVEAEIMNRGHTTEGVGANGTCAIHRGSQAPQTQTSRLDGRQRYSDKGIPTKVLQQRCSHKGIPTKVFRQGASKH